MKTTCRFIVILLFFFPVLVQSQTTKQALNEYNWLVNFVEDNYPGYSVKVDKANKEKWGDLVSVHRQKLKQHPDSLVYYMDSYVSSFKDYHLYLKLSQDGRKFFANILSSGRVINNSLPKPSLRKFTDEELSSLRQKPFNSLEGIRVGKRGTIAIIKDNGNYKVYALALSGVNDGTELGEFTPTESCNIYAARKDKLFHTDKFYCYYDNRFLEFEGLGVFVKQTENKLFDEASFLSLPEQHNRRNINMYYTAKAVNDSTFFIRVPSFSDEESNKLVSDNREAILSRPYLIIDLRENNGGNDPFFYELARLVYDGPYPVHGVEMYATKDFLKLYKEIAAQAKREGKADVSSYYAEMADSVKKHLGGYALRPGMKRINMKVQDTIYAYPRKIGIIINGANASSAEQFILGAGESKKVTLFGNENTLGCIDLSNVYKITSPQKWFDLFIPTTRTCRWPEKVIDGYGIAPQVAIPFPYYRQERDHIGNEIYFIEKYLQLIKDDGKVTIKGYAENLKNGAAIISEDGTFYYIDGLFAWDVDRGTSIIVTGIMDTYVIKPEPEENGEYVQRIGDDSDGEITVRYIKDAEWKADLTRKSVQY